MEISRHCRPAFAPDESLLLLLCSFGPAKTVAGYLFTQAFALVVLVFWSGFATACGPLMDGT